MLNDVSVLRKIKEGDIKTFEYVFRLYYSGLMLYALSITGRKDVSEEIVQELFYKLWKERESLTIIRSMKSYLYGAVRNQSLQYCEHQDVRKRYRQYMLLVGESVNDANPEEELLYKELENIINKTLQKQSERRRQIFTMHRMEGKKYKEIAGLLGLSIKTVEAEMTKMYQALRIEIEKYINTI
ncbi:RNA polymerase sigma-70 factor [Bacteroides sp. OttesenSCG-928-E20]|nr:RNA polymerase sigma-70 factor [Bacteroides sp. OttesenSCG-928-E20]